MKRMRTFTSWFIVIRELLIVLSTQLLARVDTIAISGSYLYQLNFLNGSIKSGNFNRQLYSSHRLTGPLLVYHRFLFRLYEPANQYFLDHHKNEYLYRPLLVLCPKYLKRKRLAFLGAPVVRAIQSVLITICTRLS
jgi:hypothetical protein